MRSKTTLTVTVLGGIAALALTGCSNPGGTAGPTTGAPTTTATSSADKVSNPLDTAKLQQNLCGGLTPAQLAPYMGNVGNTSTNNQSGYTTCNLHPTDLEMATVSISVYPNLGPSGMIASGANFPYAKSRASIEGYPASNTALQNPPSGQCATGASVSDHVTVEVTVQWSDKSSQYYNNPCTVSDALAPLLIDNIKASR